MTMPSKGLFTMMLLPRQSARTWTMPAILIALMASAGCATNRPLATPVYFPAPPAQPHVVHLVSFNRLYDLAQPRASWREIYRGRLISPSVGVPAGIAYRDGVLYICDTARKAVHKWNLSTGRASLIGVDGDGALSNPVDVAVDAAGTVYVADSERGEIVVLDPSGRRTGRLVPPDRDAYRPVAVAARGAKLYAADVVAHAVDVYTDGSHVTTCGGPGNELGKFYFPMGVATGPSGSLIVSDMMNARAQVLNSSCKATLSMGQPGNRYGDMGKPKHVAVGPDGTIFVADAEFARIQLFNADGQLLMLLGGEDDAPGSTPMPLGVAIAETLPERLASLVPAGFQAQYYLFTTNTVGSRRIGLFAIGSADAR